MWQTVDLLLCAIAYSEHACFTCNHASPNIATKPHCKAVRQCMLLTSHVLRSNLSADIRKVVSQDLNPAAAGKPGMSALLPVGDIIFRWGARASMIFGGARQGPIMYVETQGLTNARPSNNNQFPIRNMFALDIVEQVLLCKYKGIPHFGKNFVRTFTHPACALKTTMQQQLAEFKQLQAQHDPLLLFEPQLFTRFLKGSSMSSAACDVRRECFCTSDLHCATRFKCVRSSAFPEYKVCKPPADFDAGRA